jgi:hypothetical protein
MNDAYDLATYNLPKIINKLGLSCAKLRRS